MTLIKTVDAFASEDQNLEVAEALFVEAGNILGKKLLEAKRDEFANAGATKTALAELAAGWQLAVRERHRVAEARQKESGIAGSYAVDYDAARDEIWRRLACLRAAETDPELPG